MSEQVPQWTINVQVDGENLPLTQVEDSSVRSNPTYPKTNGVAVFDIDVRLYQVQKVCNNNIDIDLVPIHRNFPYLLHVPLRIQISKIYMLSSDWMVLL